jgi:hypothetical protein
VATFDTDEWLRWLRALTASPGSERPTIELQRDEDISERLARLYDRLGAAAQRQRFQDALAALCGATTPVPHNAPALFILLQVVAHVRPPETKAYLLRCLEGRTLAGLTHQGTNLATLALAVAAAYPVDDRLVYFIDRTSQVTDDFEYLLVCLRILATRAPTPQLDLLDRVVVRATTPQRQAQVTGEIEMIVRRTGLALLYRWFRIRSAEMCDLPSEAMAFFTTFVRIRLLGPMDSAFASPDRYAAMLATYLDGFAYQFSASQLLFLGLCADLVGKTEAAFLLNRIRVASLRRDRSRPAWQLIDHNDALFLCYEDDRAVVHLDAHDGPIPLRRGRDAVVDVFERAYDDDVAA